MKRFICSVFCILLFLNALLFISPGYSAKEAVSRNITAECTISLNGERISADLTDDSEETYVSYDSAKIEIKAYEPVGGIYIKFDRTPSVWTMIYENAYYLCGNYSFLHEYQSVYSDGEVLQSDLSRIISVDEESAKEYINKALAGGTTSIPDGGTMFEEGTEALDCVISEELAIYNDLSVGDTITVTTTSETTGSLDTDTQNEIMAIFRELVKISGKTKIIANPA